MDANQYSQINYFLACIESAEYARLVRMAFRVLADGTVETDSVEEAIKVRAALLKEAHKQSGTDRKLSNDYQFSEDTKNFLSALVGGESLTSDEIAERGKISKKSIPPLIRGLNSWAIHRGLKLDSLLIRTQKSVKGKPVSTYEMTDELAEKLSPILGVKRHTAPLSTTEGMAELREFIRGRRQALFGFMEQGAALSLNGDVLTITPRNNVFIRYLNDNRGVIADLATEFYGRRISAQLGTIAPPSVKSTGGAESQHR